LSRQACPEQSRRGAKGAKFGEKSNNIFFAIFASLRGKDFLRVFPASAVKMISDVSRQDAKGAKFGEKVIIFLGGLCVFAQK
jgi:hypothetical protein